MMLEGGCLCGAVRIQSTGEIVNKGLCHCNDCRKITGSTHSTNIIVPRAGFAVTKGAPKAFTKQADSGSMLQLFFCETCGTALWSQTPTFGETVVIKAGALDSDGALEGAAPWAEIFVRNRVGWLGVVAGAVQYEAQHGPNSAAAATA